jgi:hypothetical protein
MIKLTIWLMIYTLRVVEMVCLKESDPIKAVIGKLLGRNNMTDTVKVYWSAFVRQACLPTGRWIRF